MSEFSTRIIIWFWGISIGLSIARIVTYIIHRKDNKQ